MVTERSGSGVLRFPEEIKRVPERDQVLVEAYIRVLEPIHAFYLAQKRDGFYEELPTTDLLPKDGDSPYTIIKRDPQGIFSAAEYRDVHPYKGFLRQIAVKMTEVVDVANENNDPEKGLIRDVLGSQAQAFRDGNFEGVIISSLNTRATPRYPFFVGLLDRYLDTERGIKFAMQGWLQSRDEVRYGYLDYIAQQILSKRGSQRPLRVFAGDMLAAGGMAADRPWGGNTIPSEDSIRNQVGADVYVFINNLNERVRTKLVPATRKYLPQVAQIPGWEEKMPKATYLGITGHEAGHSQIPFDDKTPSLLGGRYMAIKELMSELSGLTRVVRLQRDILSSSHRQLIIARSLVQWRSYIDEYVAEQDPDKKTIGLHYALAGEWRLNAQERELGIKVNEDGAMVVEDWDKVVETDGQLLQEMNSMLRNEKYQRGFVDRFVRFNSRYPRSYFPHNPHQERIVVIGSKDKNPSVLQAVNT